MSRLFSGCLLVGLVACPASAQRPELTVRMIMQEPESWIGDWPSRASMSEDGNKLYFWWNPRGQFPSDSLYMVDLRAIAPQPQRVDPDARRAARATFAGWRHEEFVYDDERRRKVFASEGDIYLYDRDENITTRLTRTNVSEGSPRFSVNGDAVVYVAENNLYRLDLDGGGVIQLTDLKSGKEQTDDEPDPQDSYLERQQSDLFEVLAEREEEEEERDSARELDKEALDLPPTYYYGNKRVQNLQLAPGGLFASFVLRSQSEEKETEVMDYVTESGYAEELSARAKVGIPVASRELFVQDFERDTTFAIDLSTLPGASSDVGGERTENDADVASATTEAERNLVVTRVLWHPLGRVAVVEVRSVDNKDRWITRLDAATGTLTVLDRQSDEAWIAGPGISWFLGYSTLGWVPGGRYVYYQSEETGYSHLYVVDINTGDKRQLTDGPFEVFNPSLSADGSRWFFTSSEASPFERHLYRMPLLGGTRVQLTSMPGNNNVMLSPIGGKAGIVHSFTNRPPEIFVWDMDARSAPYRVTYSPTEAWSAYPWREPDIIHIEASDGVKVPARIYEPDNPNGAAVLFVHGAGYLQNVHRWWSSYHREYMFHNLLADRGYLVLDLDYRASSGYGRDWRTSIYRHMGGRDLQDYVDASRHVGEAFNISPDRVFIYGGSYGGFITLMALFTEAEHFGGGAALRSVTDWAHYNHSYSSNILNTPVEDSLAYARSSPINFAEGLEDPLLIAHGVVDRNVQFQDVVRLAQRLIELGKKDWELAIYPVEGHGFVEPTSWTDEYRRILELIEETVGPK